jgi:hypothetical protein
MLASGVVVLGLNVVNCNTIHPLLHQLLEGEKFLVDCQPSITYFGPD